MSSPDSPAAAPVVHDHFPIVRVSAARARKRVIALYEDHLRLARFTRRTTITPEMLEPEGEAELAKLKKSRLVAYSAIKSVRVSVMGGNAQFKIVDTGGGKGAINLSLTQAPTVARILRDKLPDRYCVYKPLGRISRVGALLLALLGGYIAPIAAIMAIELGLPAFIFAVVGLGMLIFGLVAAHHSSRWRVIQAGEPALPTKRAKGHHAHHAGRQPFRSRSLGILLRLSGVIYFIWITLQEDALLAAIGDVSYQTKNYVLLLVGLPAPLLVFLGHRLAQRAYTPRKDKANQAPVLFLRSFADDGKTTLQPGGWLASLAGIRDSYGGVSTSGRITARDLIVTYNPITLLRRAFGYGSASAEETLARFFQKFGPVVAIGKPGERLATAGAARIYVSDELWQQTVLTEIERAQFVVVQPGSSKGVAWELAQVRAHANPTRVLLSLASCWGDPETTDTLAPILEEAFGMKLQRSVAFDKRPQLVYFDANWRPEFVTVSYRNPLTWPLVPDATDLRFTLRPFLARAKGEPSTDARPRWLPGGGTTFAQWGSVLIGFLVAFMCNVGIRLVANNYAVWRYEQDARMAVAGIDSIATPTTAATQPISDLATPVDSPSTGMTRLHGVAIPYTIDVPEDWKDTTSNDAEHMVQSPDGRCYLITASSPVSEDTSQLSLGRQRMLRDAGISLQSATGRALSSVGLDWTESLIAGTVNGGPVRDLVRQTNLPAGGTVVVIAMMVGDDTTMCQRAYDTAFQSFKPGR